MQDYAVPSFVGYLNLNSLYVSSFTLSRTSKLLDSVESVVSFSSGGATEQPWEILALLDGSGVQNFSFSSTSTSSWTETNLVIPSSLLSLSVKSGGTTSCVGEFPDCVVSGEGSSLTTLTVTETFLSGVSFLNDLTELTTIELNYNYITSLEGVTSTLSNVTSLNLSYNSITSLYGIQYFTGLQTLNLSYNTSLGDTCSYGGTTYFNLQLLSDLRTNNQTLTSINLTGCTDLNTDSTNSYWTTLKGLSGLTVTGP